MAAIGVDAAEQHVVAEDHLAIGEADVELHGRAFGRDAGEADDSVGCGVAQNLQDQRRHTGALDHDVGASNDVVNRAGVIGGAEIADELRLRAVRDTVENMHLIAALAAEHRREQTDRPGTGDDHDAGFPMSPPTDPLDVFPRLGNHARRFEQHADPVE